MRESPCFLNEGILSRRIVLRHEPAEGRRRESDMPRQDPRERRLIGEAIAKGDFAKRHLALAKQHSRQPHLQLTESPVPAIEHFAGVRELANEWRSHRDSERPHTVLPEVIGV